MMVSGQLYCCSVIQQTSEALVKCFRRMVDGNYLQEEMDLSRDRGSGGVGGGHFVKPVGWQEVAKTSSRMRWSSLRVRVAFWGSFRAPQGMQLKVTYRTPSSGSVAESRVESFVGIEGLK